MKWPDDYFTLYSGINYGLYTLKNYRSTFLFTDGTSNNISIEENLTRSSVDQPIYPRKGSEISFSVQFTPPYSAFTNKDYSKLDTKENTSGLNIISGNSV